MVLHILGVTLLSALLFTPVIGYCQNPKVRKEWRCLSREERASWIKAVKCLANSPHDPNLTATVDPALSLIPPINQSSSRFDDFSYVHMDLNVLIHNTGFFLPWHRQFVQTFEDELRSKCGYDGVQPYWDWTKDTADFYHATIFSDDDYSGLGSWGDPNNDFQICTGGFKDMKLSYPVPHGIRRNYTLYFSLPPEFPSPPDASAPDPSLMMNATFTTEVVNSLLTSFTGNYSGFQATLENYPGPHTGPHLSLGGDLVGLCPFGLKPPNCNPGMKWAPNDPLFFLHHAMLDKVWYDWQHLDPRNKNLFAGGSVSWQVNSSVLFHVYPTGAPPLLNTGSVIPSDGLWGETTVGDVLDTVGGRLCYVYE